MNPKIVYSESDQSLIQTLVFIEYNRGYIKEPTKGLDIKIILHKCAQAWEIDESLLIGKINHSDNLDKIRKTSFLFGCRLFSNSSDISVKKLVGYGGGGILYRSSYKILYEIQRQSMYALQIISFIRSLITICKSRIDKLAEVDIERIGEVSDWGITAALSSYQISKIPLRDEQWFTRVANKVFDGIFIVYHPLKVNNVRYVKPSRNIETRILLQLQNTGYRFLEHMEFLKYVTRHGVCDKCLKKNDCAFKKHRQFGGTYGEFLCFEEVPENTLKAPKELLYELSLFRLQ